MVNHNATEEEVEQALVESKVLGATQFRKFGDNEWHWCVFAGDDQWVQITEEPVMRAELEELAKDRPEAYWKEKFYNSPTGELEEYAIARTMQVAAKAALREEE